MEGFEQVSRRPFRLDHVLTESYRSLPELDIDFDDSDFVVADLTETNVSIRRRLLVSGTKRRCSTPIFRLFMGNMF